MIASRFRGHAEIRLESTGREEGPISARTVLQSAETDTLDSADLGDLADHLFIDIQGSNSSSMMAPDPFVLARGLPLQRGGRDFNHDLTAFAASVPGCVVACS